MEHSPPKWRRRYLPHPRIVSRSKGGAARRASVALHFDTKFSTCARMSEHNGVILRKTSCNACVVAIYRMGNRSSAKIRGKWERKWKMAPGLKWPKNCHRNGKMAPENGILFSQCFHFVAIFRPFQAGGHFPFSFPFSPDFCTGPVSHSVDGHRTRKQRAQFGNCGG